MTSIWTPIIQSCNTVIPIWLARHTDNGRLHASDDKISLTPLSSHPHLLWPHWLFSFPPPTFWFANFHTLAVLIHPHAFSSFKVTLWVHGMLLKMTLRDQIRTIHGPPFIVPIISCQQFIEFPLWGLEFTANIKKNCLWMSNIFMNFNLETYKG